MFLQSEPIKVKPEPKEKRPREQKLPKDFVKMANAAAYMVPPASKAETAFRHSWWEVKREKVKAAMIAGGISSFSIDRFEQCGSECTIEWSPSKEKYRVCANYCKCRHCEPCMKGKAGKIAANLRNRLDEKTTGRYRFITLTLRHTDGDLLPQIRRLYACFKKLRTSKLWKESQRGGALMLEVKWNPKARQWHPHLHILTEGDFIQQAALSNAWHAATGDSHVVDIRKIDSGKDAAHYISKYVTKGTNSDLWNDPAAASEWITASKGVRVCATFGSWRGFKLTAPATDPGDWKPICTLHRLIQGVSGREAWAEGMLLAIRPPGDSDGPKRTAGTVGRNQYLE